MGTKTTIKHGYDKNTDVGFSLKTDWLDECAGVNVVHLRLDNVSYVAGSGDGCAWIDITMPRDTAEQMGLIPAKEAP